ncbi:diguanylate cyclase [Vibrio rumoiensis]|uniref:diguanylate cyclase n=1 Tax=Vibrio rumoiensis TaxID=76258 RepID=UPI003748D644
MLLALLVGCSFFLSMFPAHVNAENITPHHEKSYQVALVKDDIGSKIVFDELAKHFQLKVNYIYYDQFSGILDALKNNTTDFVPNVTYSQEREKYFDISPPTNMEYTYLYTLPKFSMNKSLSKVHSIAVADNLIFEQFLKEHYPQIKVVSFSNYPQALNMLNKGEVDGVIDGISKLKRFLNDGISAQMLNSVLPIQPVGIATGKGQNAALLNAMVDYLHTPEMQKTLRQITEAYQYEYQLGALRKRVARTGVDTTTTLKVKLENVTVLSKYQADGKPQGVAVDVLNKSCQILGFHCEIVSQPGDQWTGMLSDLLNNKIDVLGPMVISNNRKDSMYFSQPFFDTESVVVKRTGYKEGIYKSLSEMVIEKISVVRGDYYDQLLTNLLPGKKLYRMETREDQIQALKEGKVDYVILNRPNYIQMLVENTADFSTEEDADIGVFQKTPLGFAFPKTDKGQQLAELFSAAQSLIDRSAIIQHYYVQPNWRSILQKEQRTNYIVWSVFTLSIVFMLVVIGFVYRQAITDNLTQLKNRRALYQKYASGIPTRITLVYLDVNKFKVINDTYGHNAGDAVLQQLAELILQHWPGAAFRLGGDEFVLVGELSDRKLQSVLNELQSFTVDIDGQVFIDVTTSCGVSRFREKMMEIDDVLHLADKEMYMAKANFSSQ